MYAVIARVGYYGVRQGTGYPVHRQNNPIDQPVKFTRRQL